MITLTELRAGMKRLEAVFALPKGARDNPDLYADTWLDVLGWMQPTDFDASVTAYLRSGGEYWPKPGQLVAWVNKQPVKVTPRSDLYRRYMAWEDGGWDRALVAGQFSTTPCPVCGANVELFPRIRVTHITDRHRAATVLIIGWSDRIAKFYASVPWRGREPHQESVTFADASYAA